MPFKALARKRFLVMVGYILHDNVQWQTSEIGPRDSAARRLTRSPVCSAASRSVRRIARRWARKHSIHRKLHDTLGLRIYRLGKNLFSMFDCL